MTDATTGATSPANAAAVQSPLSLFMPLANVDSAFALLKEKQSELGGALNSIHTVHFARFMLLNLNNQPTLALFTEYDGDFTTYVKDFVAKLGPIFDALLANVVDPPPTPVADNVDAFVSWVQAHDYNTPEKGLLTFYSAYPQLTVVDILSQSS
jgi:hypothetical protein